MLILALTTDKLQLITDAAVTVDVHATIIDCSTASPPVVDAPDKQNTAISTATTTDIVAAPASGKRRNIKTLHIRNKHASSAVSVTVQFNANATLYELHKELLLAGESLEYIEGIGFFKLGVVNARFRTVKLGSDQSNSTTSLTEVTGMTLLTGVGTFVFEYYLIMQSAATTTGQRFSVNHDGTLTSFVANVFGAGTGTSAVTDAQDQDMVAAGATLHWLFTARAKSTAGWGTTTAVDTANADLLVRIQGIMVVTVDGNIELWHGSEVAAQSTVKAGSALVLTKVD